MISVVLNFQSADNTEATNPPVWWGNFMTANGPTATDNESGFERRNTILLGYSAQCYLHKSVDRGTLKHVIDFYDEKAYAWFMLKYS